MSAARQKTVSMEIKIGLISLKEALEEGLQNVPGRIRVTSDFNTRAIEWGMTITNTRVKHILQMASRLNLEIVNRGSAPTYTLPGLA